MKTYWIFMAYKNEDNYPLKPFHTKLFEDFNKMKTHSGKHSYRYKHDKYYPDYVSDYIKIKIITH